jgi:Ca-activated chloride channel homolog
MHQKLIFRLLSIFALAGIAIMALAKTDPVTTTAQESDTQGALQVLDPTGKPKARCPLKHTDVKAEISGYLARVVVTQEFANPFKEKIEAVYTFPLPQDAAVDDMTMLVGDRTVKGKILRREEAEAVYEAAKAGGQVASLLNQQRPNIFTQSVANIMPGEQVKITISYVETLKYENGSYAFVFPMVVGPRYIPGSPSESASPSGGNGFSGDTDQVPDASRITPQPVPKGMRVGHDISLDINLDAGVPIDSLSSGSHPVETERSGASQARVRLKDNSVIPNKDFILRYDVAGSNITDALLTHRADKGGFFTFILQPPERITTEDVTPKELVFVLDTSGSMSGFPIEKAKETMRLALNSLYPGDTFNLITFAGDTHVLFPQPVPVSPANLQKAQAFLAGRAGMGGTEMMQAIKTALDPSDSQTRMRIVCFMTDGFVGNDMEIIAEVAKHRNARVFAFGIGSSVNRFLLDKMAEYGRGEVEYVGLNDDGSAAARRFHERVRNPLLTDISIDWNGLPVTDVYPERISDLFGAKPVTLTGRYTAPASGTFRLKGKMSGRDFVREIPVTFPESMAHHDVLASLWARSRIDNLMGQDYAGMQQGAMRPDLKETITNLGLEFRLMTQFTSFVAVEEMIVTDGGQPRRVEVPVEVPEGVNRDAVFGYDSVKNLPVAGRAYANFALVSPGVAASPKPGGVLARRKASGAGIGTGSGGGVGAGRAGNTGGPVIVDGSNKQTSDSKLVLPEQIGLATISGEEEQRRLMIARLHPSLLAVVERLKTGKPAGADELKFVRDGKAEVRIWLTEKSEEALADLKKLGFEIVLEPKTAKLVIGRLPVENLKKLGELKWVKYAAPEKI